MDRENNVDVYNIITHGEKPARLNKISRVHNKQ